MYLNSYPTPQDLESFHFVELDVEKLKKWM